MHRRVGFMRVVKPGRVEPLEIPNRHHGLRLIQGHPGWHAIAKSPKNRVGIFGEALRGVTAHPAALIFKLLWSIPVPERRERLNTPLQQAVDQPPVEIEPALIDCARAAWENARPGDREAIALDTERLHEIQVLLVAVVMIACDVAGVAMLHPAGCMAKAIPNRLAATIGLDCALDLIRGCCDTPAKPCRKA